MIELARAQISHSSRKISTLAGSKSSERQPASSIHVSKTKIGRLLPIVILVSGWLWPVAPPTCECLVERWTIGISDGLNSSAELVASESGSKNLGLLSGFDDVYLFEKPANAATLHQEKRALELHPLVDWVEPQLALKRTKRDNFQLFGRHHQRPLMQLVASSLSTTINRTSRSTDKRPLNDELWSHQWYLQSSSSGAKSARSLEEISLRVEDVWRMGFTGQGVVVTVLDDGLEYNHTDLVANYDPLASWDMHTNNQNPFPRHSASYPNNHGTRCAGEIAMVANNRKCGVGVAPRARIGGIKCLDDFLRVEDNVEAKSLVHNLDHIDIYSASWGPKDNGWQLEGPHRTGRLALERGIKSGRQGKGALYVWATGNGGPKDDCNCDGYVNSIYTLSIGAVTQHGRIPYYGEHCSSSFAVTCSHGTHIDRKIVTTDLGNKCTVEFDGTSAAAPLATGVYALALEANRNLTWRDVQHLTVWTSNPIPLRDNPGWKRNGAGLIFNNKLGFGLMNAKALVEAALKWQTVPKKSICLVTPKLQLPKDGYLKSRDYVQVVFESDGCQRDSEQRHSQKQMMVQQQPVNGITMQSKPIRSNQNQQNGPVIFLEHVQVEIDLDYSLRGALDISLVSPSGTISTLLSRRPNDLSRDGFNKWNLMSVHFWAETSLGAWTLIIRDKDSQNQRGMLHNTTLKLHGTSIRPQHVPTTKRLYEGEFEVAPFLDPVPEMDVEEDYDQYSDMVTRG